MAAQNALGLSGDRALEWGLSEMCCKLHGGSMGQLVTTMSVVPTQESQRHCKDLCNVRLSRAKRQSSLSSSKVAYQFKKCF